MLLVLGLAMATTAGCAHGTLATGEGRDLRGSARIGQAARVLLVGPARLVHATGEKPVRWFVAERVSGGDADCAVSSSAQITLSESRGANLTVGAGHVLCAAVADGSTDVMWHEQRETNSNMWALR
jgi:hypothetical protein